MSDISSDKEGSYARCLAECHDGLCYARPVRDRLGLLALRVDDIEPAGGPFTDKLQQLHASVVAVCLEQRVNAELFPSLEED
jgi:hypothetical protein